MTSVSSSQIQSESKGPAWKLAIILLGFFCLVWIAGYIFFLARIDRIYVYAPAHQNDGIVVLTGGSKRIKEGLDLLREDRGDQLLITGVHADVGIDDVLSREQKFPDNLRRCCITLGHRAENTPGNAREARQWAHRNTIKSIYLVTSNYHIDRALIEFSALLPDVRIDPRPVSPDLFDGRYIHYWLLTFVEYNKLLYTILLHGLEAMLLRDKT